MSEEQRIRQRLAVLDEMLDLLVVGSREILDRERRLRLALIQTAKMPRGRPS